MLGTGWAPLSSELEQQLRQLDPPGELLEATVGASGLPKFRVRLEPSVRAEGRRIVREFENRAAELCELCGGAGTVRAGVIITARCEHCV